MTNPDSSRLDRIERMIEAQAANLAAESDRRASVQEDIDICFQLNRQTSETLDRISDSLSLKRPKTAGVVALCRN